jgi:hypothetical protein
MVEGAVEHRREAVRRIVLRLLGRIDAAAVDADADGAVVVASDGDQIADFLLPGLLALVVVEVARVVAELVDVRREPLGEPVVFLQINDQVCLGLLANLGDSVGFGTVVDGDADDVGTGFH